MTETLNNRVRIKSLVDVVTERLEAAIISGELAPGEKVSEQKLADSLGVSRGPLREAIRRLEGRKLVDRTPNIGVRIASLSLRDLTDLLEVREALEGMAARLAAERMPEQDISALATLLDKHRKQVAAHPRPGYYQEAKDFDFHFRIANGSGNVRLSSMLCGDLYDLMRVYRYKSSTQEGRAEKALDEHQAIIDAIAKRDANLAEAKMREHIRKARAVSEQRIAASGFGNVRGDDSTATPAPLPTKKATSRTASRRAG
jgi:DNA-binding GntR family transcriptional regulator